MVLGSGGVGKSALVTTPSAPTFLGSVVCYLTHSIPAALPLRFLIFPACVHTRICIHAVHMGCMRPLPSCRADVLHECCVHATWPFVVECVEARPPALSRRPSVRFDATQKRCSVVCPPALRVAMQLRYDSPCLLCVCRIVCQYGLSSRRPQSAESAAAESIGAERAPTRLGEKIDVAPMVTVAALSHVFTILKRLPSTRTDGAICAGHLRGEV